MGNCCANQGKNTKAQRTPTTNLEQTLGRTKHRKRAPVVSQDPLFYEDPKELVKLAVLDDQKFIRLVKQN